MKDLVVFEKDGYLNASIHVKNNLDTPIMGLELIAVDTRLIEWELSKPYTIDFDMLSYQESIEWIQELPGWNQDIFSEGIYAHEVHYVKFCNQRYLISDIFFEADESRQYEILEVICEQQDVQS